MACATCGSGAGNPNGCQNNGYCSSGGCNRLNTFDWLSLKQISDPRAFELVEVGYKNGARKEFCHCPAHLQITTGDMVVVDEVNGFNIGQVSLSGELVRMQMRKKKTTPDRIANRVVRIANSRDLERLQEARGKEQGALVRSRAIARTLGVELKMGDVEYRGDGRKATFYYTADGRVDFRELVRNYAREFRVKIEMRQIGARQESSRIGGVGSCGRELCCSTWLTDFKSVTTSAARYQNLSINQSKLSGQCGRLKCCLNYELDTYLDALQDFPRHVDRLKTTKGMGIKIKTDIFKRLIYYAYETERGKSNITPVHIDRVKEIKAMNDRGEYPDDLLDKEAKEELEEVILDFEDVTGAIELPEEKRSRRRRGRGGRSRRRQGQGSTNQKPSGHGRARAKQEHKESNPSAQISAAGSGKGDDRRKRRSRNRSRKPKSNNNQS